MPSTARSTPNIALIKYWGNRNNELRLPMADSLSMTLDRPWVEVTVEHAEDLVIESLQVDGRTGRGVARYATTMKDIQRFEKHLALTKRYLTRLDAPNAIPESLAISIRSEIPRSVGIASSAAVFSALAHAIQGLVAPTISLTDEQTSVIARLGSGSACRGIGDGFVAMIAGEGDAIDSAVARQIAAPDHWVIHDIIIVPSHEEKKVGSTEGHALAQTSPFFLDRIEAIQTRRQSECIDAILTRNFEKLQRVSEEDCLDMHHVMETSTPALTYLSGETHRIIGEISTLRDENHLPVLYTMDAGPTVHLFCTEEALDDVLAFSKQQQHCTVIEAKVGRGAMLLHSYT